ncbi:hypothetical protein Nepgr_028485 [Nepenthes gracilis]|uniref:Uncharacterized protein n=1 Tax=Nepenthes gracilis TaxID=150966 RepID=A0AAD3TDT7_NEPGR|nr:hypothetical protein Nepgr_028485 [Nepenthes gracilis]
MKPLGIASPLKEKPSMEAEERVMNIPNWDGFRATLRMEGTWWKILGNKIISSALEEKQLEASNKQGLKRIVRSTLESTLHGTDEPMHLSSRDEHVEDAVVMDYAQPHRKPPIHNHKP